MGIPRYCMARLALQVEVGPVPRFGRVVAELVRERLGHAATAITMDTYSHVLTGLDELAARPGRPARSPGQVARLILGAATRLLRRSVSIRSSAADMPSRQDRNVQVDGVRA